MIISCLYKSLIMKWMKVGMAVGQWQGKTKVIYKGYITILESFSIVHSAQHKTTVYTCIAAEEELLQQNSKALLQIKYFRPIIKLYYTAVNHLTLLSVIISIRKNYHNIKYILELFRLYSRNILI